MRRRFMALVLVALVCGGCKGGSAREEPKEGQAAVWFLTAPSGGETELSILRDSGSDSCLSMEFRELPQGRDGVEELMGLLLSGPESDDLRSPFPQGTELKSWSVEDGLALLDLSEAYGGLSGVELSLADACITMTLCRLPQVERVYLTVEGRQRPYRDQVLSPDDFLLSAEVEGVREETVRLWFPRGQSVGWEDRTVRLAEGDRLDVAAVQALLSGPEDGTLEPFCAAGVELRRLTVEDGRYVAVWNSAWDSQEEDPRRSEALARTLSGILGSPATVEVQTGE